MTQGNGENHQAIQELSRRWWEQNPMAYSWREPIPFEEGSWEFFDEVDRRFFSAARFFAGEPPFARLIPFDRSGFSRSDAAWAPTRSFWRRPGPY